MAKRIGGPGFPKDIWCLKECRLVDSCLEAPVAPCSLFSRCVHPRIGLILRDIRRRETISSGNIAVAKLRWWEGDAPWSSEVEGARRWAIPPKEAACPSKLHRLLHVPIRLYGRFSVPALGLLDVSCCKLGSVSALLTLHVNCLCCDATFVRDETSLSRSTFSLEELDIGSSKHRLRSG